MAEAEAEADVHHQSKKKSKKNKSKGKSKSKTGRAVRQEQTSNNGSNSNSNSNRSSEQGTSINSSGQNQTENTTKIKKPKLPKHVRDDLREKGLPRKALDADGGALFYVDTGMGEMPSELVAQQELQRRQEHDRTKEREQDQKQDAADEMAKQDKTVPDYVGLQSEVVAEPAPTVMMQDSSEGITEIVQGSSKDHIAVDNAEEQQEQGNVSDGSGGSETSSSGSDDDDDDEEEESAEEGEEIEDEGRDQDKDKDEVENEDSADAIDKALDLDLSPSSGDENQEEPRRPPLRYFKEDSPANNNSKDPLPTCQRCGGSGHSVRDCDHLQCATCGKLDDHETRLCPVTRNCTRCGQKGHSNRVGMGHIHSD